MAQVLELLFVNNLCAFPFANNVLKAIVVKGFDCFLILVTRVEFDQFCYCAIVNHFANLSSCLIALFGIRRHDISHISVPPLQVNNKINMQYCCALFLNRTSKGNGCSKHTGFVMCAIVCQIPTDHLLQNDFKNALKIQCSDTRIFTLICSLFLACCFNFSSVSWLMSIGAAFLSTCE